LQSWPTETIVLLSNQAIPVIWLCGWASINQEHGTRSVNKKTISLKRKTEQQYESALGSSGHSLPIQSTIAALGIISHFGDAKPTGFNKEAIS
jgi:hypothetical protein